MPVHTIFQNNTQNHIQTAPDHLSAPALALSSLGLHQLDTGIHLCQYEPQAPESTCSVLLSETSLWNIFSFPSLVSFRLLSFSFFVLYIVLNRLSTLCDLSTSIAKALFLAPTCIRVPDNLYIPDNVGCAMEVLKYSIAKIGWPYQCCWCQIYLAQIKYIFTLPYQKLVDRTCKWGVLLSQQAKQPKVKFKRLRVGNGRGINCQVKQQGIGVAPATFDSS